MAARLQPPRAHPGAVQERRRPHRGHHRSRIRGRARSCPRDPRDPRRRQAAGRRRQRRRRLQLLPAGRRRRLHRPEGQALDQHRRPRPRRHLRLPGLLRRQARHSRLLQAADRDDCGARVHQLRWRAQHRHGLRDPGLPGLHQPHRAGRRRPARARQRGGSGDPDQGPRPHRQPHRPDHRAGRLQPHLPDRRPHARLPHGPGHHLPLGLRRDPRRRRHGSQPLLGRDRG